MASPNVLSPRVVRPETRQQRVTRSPSQPFGLIWKPWQIQPCGIFPVFPGETMTSQMVQFQFWTDPLKANLKNTPWTMEYFSYYVKFRDLPGWEVATDGPGKDLVDMIESDESISSLADADGNAWTYCAPGGVDFLLEATKRVVEVYFREDGQAWDKATVDGVPLAAVRPPANRDVMNKLAAATVVDNLTQVPNNFGSEWWQALQDMAAHKELLSDGSTNEVSMDYEDIVRASGGRAVVRNPDREDLHVPELLGYVRHWGYPVNTVEPSTGTPAVAFGSRIKQAQRKMFRFPEFGWICNYVLLRPKVFWKNQEGLFAGMMQQRGEWMMPYRDHATSQGFLSIDDTNGPLKTVMTTDENYMVDLRDLFAGGEQFLNYAPAAANDAVVTLPEADYDRDYPTSTDVMAVFSNTTDGRIRANGVVDISFKTFPPIVGTGQPTGRVLQDWA